MGKFVTYILIITGTILAFYIFGLLDPTDNTTLISLLINPESIVSSTYWLTFTGVFTAIGIVGGIIIGLVSKNFELTVMAALGTYLINLLVDFWKVYQVLKNVNEVIALLVLSPLLFLLVISVVDWWRGRD